MSRKHVPQANTIVLWVEQFLCLPPYQEYIRFNFNPLSEFSFQFVYLNKIYKVKYLPSINTNFSIIEWFDTDKNRDEKWPQSAGFFLIITQSHTCSQFYIQMLKFCRITHLRTGIIYNMHLIYLRHLIPSNMRQSVPMISARNLSRSVNIK